MKGFIEVSYSKRNYLIAVSAIVGIADAVPSSGNREGVTITLAHGLPPYPASINMTAPGIASTGKELKHLKVSLSYQEVVRLIEAAS